MGANSKFKVATLDLIEALKLLSTESLIIWILGESAKKKTKLSIEDIVLESWHINPEKHSLRGYSEYPDSFVVMKRIFDMKGRKGLIDGTTSGGFILTQISKTRFLEIEQQLVSKFQKKITPKKGVDRTISSIDEAPYRRLLRTPAYRKYKDNKLEQIVESDFLYFYGVNWTLNKAAVEGKLKNIDTVVSIFKDKDPLLVKVRDFLNSRFEKTKNTLVQ